MMTSSCAPITARWHNDATTGVKQLVIQACLNDTRITKNKCEILITGLKKKFLDNTLKEHFVRLTDSTQHFNESKSIKGSSENSKLMSKFGLCLLHGKIFNRPFGIQSM